jgi:hypothetical protein
MNVSTENQTVTSLLTTAESAVAIDIQTDVETQNIDVVQTRAVTIWTLSLTM